MVKAEQDYYQILGLSQNADKKTIQEAFQKLALKYHPDRNKSPEAANRYTKIVYAYLILSDAQKYKQNEEENFLDYVQNTSYANVFSSGKKTQQTKGQDLEIRAYITLEKIASGGDEQITVHRQFLCKSCNGTGAAARSQLKNCTSCSGSGQKVTRSEERTDSLFQQITSCPACHGKGRVITTPCPQCLGIGKADKQESLTIKIPKGANDGLIIRIPKHGSAATNPSLPAGDLYICIQTFTDSRFQRKGAELWHAKTIDVTDAVLGVELKIPTLEGYTKLKIPAGTQNNEIFTIKEKGLPIQGSNQYGDLHIRIFIHIPTHITEPEKSLYKKLRSHPLK